MLVSIAMVVETAMSLASPWPLKIVLDSVFDSQPAPSWLAWIGGGSPDRMALINAAAIGTVVIALLQAGSAYLNAYFTVSIGQWIAHDLRQSICTLRPHPCLAPQRADGLFPALRK